MQFIKSALLPGEKLAYYTKPHWIIFAPATILFIVTFVILVIGPHYASLEMKIFPWAVYQICAALVAVVAIWWALHALIVFYTSEYGVTNKRVIMKTGLISRDTAEIFLDKIEAVNVDQSILGRLLEYGTLIIIGTGGTRDIYYNVPNPFMFRRASQTQVDSDRNAQHHVDE